MFKLICSLFVVNSRTYLAISSFVEEILLIMVFRNSSESLPSFITKTMNLD